MNDRVVRLADLLLAPLVLPAAALLREVRRTGLARMPVSRAIFRRVGVYPVRDHYYEPVFRRAAPDARERELPGIDWNVDEQLRLLDRFDVAAELERFPLERVGDGGFYYHNRFFESGDAEFLYALLRTLRPRRLYEIGSGFSTLMARAAIRRNAELDPTYRCEHVCIEPYENRWLDHLGIRIVRERVEALDPGSFAPLAAGDVLFIDSSHVVRAGGDVVYEYLRLLPTLAPGVFVHVHDIFSPRDYPARWRDDELLLWNEQYLVEAFLSFNTRFRIVGALNFLAHHHREALAARFPVYAREAAFREPASLWLVSAAG
ncbi:MAG TPA: class I SAM-dependent methyltransferase [Longimicrobiales bacterium]|nr:class I SAM-dependent methyltransferase [Longimicrobiales bacterium]